MEISAHFLHLQLNLCLRLGSPLSLYGLTVGCFRANYVLVLKCVDVWCTDTCNHWKIQHCIIWRCGINVRAFMRVCSRVNADLARVSVCPEIWVLALVLCRLPLLHSGPVHMRQQALHSKDLGLRWWQWLWRSFRWTGKPLLWVFSNLSSLWAHTLKYSRKWSGSLS